MPNGEKFDDEISRAWHEAIKESSHKSTILSPKQHEVLAKILHQDRLSRRLVRAKGRFRLRSDRNR